MKIKYNIPMLNELKDKANNIKEKINRNKVNKEKVPMRYYTLLVLMLIVGLITFSANLKKYNDINTENYIEYTLNDNIEADSNEIENIIYETAVSSISTNISNMDETNQNLVNKTKYIWPVEGPVIKEHALETLAYSKTLDMWRIHPGIDISAHLGSTVKAVEKGVVIEIYQDSFYGNSIKIEHDGGYISIYSNLDEIQEVSEGAQVIKGQIIGRLGVSAQGEIADESHLHFELLKDNEWINPLEILE